ncbi:GLPGLI family protein [Chryseobacterium sp. GMJ5]|uniref:GLPGLI family protein n=1 Tax=Chryseobacterium gilvum TaxID=2976534 RepID=A0ABT2VTS2_9FLAO|nr:GLPGLI family protein [Chryseobacterium gilvum]MCU7613251.1 GLPGLI family protein [Chryseobacterium gilvum]
MKLCTLFLIIFGSILYSQTNDLKSQYEVIYRIKSFPDTLSKKNTIEEDLSLLINGNKSLFKSTKKAYSDSIAMEIGEKSLANSIDGKVILDMRNVPIVNFKSEVFFDNGKQTVYKELVKNRFSYPLEDVLHWKIEEETKMIGSYLCKKATIKYKNRNYAAWFAESVPIPDGPYIFKGLPGLILEVYDQSDTVHFSMVSLKKVEKPMVVMKDSAATKYSIFYQARKLFRQSGGCTIQSDRNKS